MRANALACGIAPKRFSRRLRRHRVRHPGAGIRTKPVTSAPATAPIPAHRPMHARGNDRRQMPAAARTPVTFLVPDIVGNGSPAARTRSRATPTTRPSSRCARLHRDPAATIARSGLRPCASMRRLRSRDGATPSSARATSRSGIRTPPQRPHIRSEAASTCRSRGVFAVFLACFRALRAQCACMLQRIGPRGDTRPPSCDLLEVRIFGPDLATGPFGRCRSCAARARALILNGFYPSNR